MAFSKGDFLFEDDRDVTFLTDVNLFRKFEEI